MSCYEDRIFIYDSGISYIYSITSLTFQTLPQGPILNSSCAILTQSSAYVLFGLESSDFSYNIYSIDLQELTWTYKTTENTAHLFGCAYIENNIYTFGGIEIQGLSNKLTKYYIDNIQSEIISSNITYPKARRFATMTYLLGSAYLIGGEYQGELLNDVWKLDIIKNTWHAVEYYNDFKGISKHCACSFAGSVVVFGGMTRDGLTSELLELSSELHWSKVSTSENKPSPRASACIVSVGAVLYIFGGVTHAGLSPELWKFEFGTLSYVKIATYVIGIAYHHCEIEDDILFVSFGKLSSGQYNSDVLAFSLSSLTFSTISTISYTATGSAVMTSSSYILLLGGEYYSHLSNSIYLFNVSDGAILEKHTLQSYFYGGSYTAFNKTIIVFGGSRGINSIPLSSNEASLYKIQYSSFPCPKGTKISNKTCEACPPGTYSDTLNSNDCTNCSKGTYNNNSMSHSKVFCLPCPYGYFSNEEGLSACYSCPSFSYCPVGAINPKIAYTESSITSINPNLSQSSTSAYNITLNLEIASIILGLAIIIWFALHKRFRVFIKIADIFKQNHNDKLNEPMILKKTEIGGCFTILFVIAGACLSAVTIIYFTLENSSTSQALVPLVSILQDYPDISGDITFWIYLNNYGGVCPINIACKNAIYAYDMEYSLFDTSCESIDGNCILTSYCKNCRLKSFPQLSMKVTGELCFASSIDVNITASSGIENKISSVIVDVQPETSKVLIGNTPSVVTIDTIYSVFDNEPSLKTGYYVISSTKPTLGSTFDPSDVPFYTSLFLEINLSKQNSALLTKVSQQQAFSLIFTGLLGGITGLLQIFSYFMDLTEGFFMRILYVIKSRRIINKSKKKSRKLDNNFDNSSVLATKKSLLMTDSARSYQEFTCEDGITMT